MKNYDIIIAGGGMAGATAAIALSKLKYNIALVEPIQPELDTSPSFDQRAVALSAASISIFNTLGIWEKIEKLAEPISHIHISDQGHFGFTRLKAEDYGVEALGQVIPLDEAGPILWKILSEIKNIDLICPAKISEIDSAENQSQTNKITVTLNEESKEQKLTAKLMLAADGTFSSIANLAGIETKRTSYDQHAVIANIATELPHNNRAFERFTKNGPLALLPLTQNRMSLVWCQREKSLDRIMNYDDQQFIEELQKEFGFRLGQITKVGSRFQYPLSLHLPEKIYQGRTLLLGNAAHTLHPIAGQGFNIGLRDIAALYDSVQQAIKEEQDIGSKNFLQGFQEKTQGDKELTVNATDFLARIFTSEFLPVVVARNKGLCLLNKIPFVKKQLANAAMGFHGNSAQLTRGIGLES